MPPIVTPPFIRALGRSLTASSLAIFLSSAPQPTIADGLPPPSRTVFKCAQDGKTVYSDSPCPGAARLEIEPTRGVSKLSGQERIGPDVRREKQREAFAEAIRPLTGMDAKDYEIQSRRISLSSSARQECQSLDRALPQAEAEERSAAQSALSGVQARLFALRRRFRELRC